MMINEQNEQEVKEEERKKEEEEVNRNYDEEDRCCCWVCVCKRVVTQKECRGFGPLGVGTSANWMNVQRKHRLYVQRAGKQASNIYNLLLYTRQPSSERE